MRTTLLVSAQLSLVLFLTGCAGAHNPSDPFEPFNRSVYLINDSVDRAVVKPVAQAYDTVMPKPVKIMAGNFISNLDDATITVNDLLQFKFSQAASDGSRFIFNSTFGIFGLLDVTSRLEKHREDFGQTMGFWGIGNGPYLVLPILGPSSVRDAAGLYIDTGPSVPGQVHHVPTRNQYYLASGIHRRSTILDQEKVIDEATIDRYQFIRDVYLLHRRSLVYDGNPPRERYDDEYYEDE